MDNRTLDRPPPYEPTRYNTHDGLPSNQIREDRHLLRLQSVSNTQARLQPEGPLNLLRVNLAISPDRQVDPPPSYEEATYNTQYGLPLSQQLGADKHSLEGLPQRGASRPHSRLQPQEERNSSHLNQAFSPKQQVPARPKPGTQFIHAGFRRQGNRYKLRIKPQTLQSRPHRTPGYRQPEPVLAHMRQTTQPAIPLLSVLQISQTFNHSSQTTRC